MAGLRIEELGGGAEKVIEAARAFSNAFPSATWPRLDPPRLFASGAFVAVQDGISLPVGVGGVLGVYDGQATVEVAVAVEHRGKGIGRALLDAVESSVPSDVRRLAVLRSDTTDPRTERFLRARGYEQQVEEPWSWLTDLSRPAPHATPRVGHRVEVLDRLDDAIAHRVARIEAQWHTDRGYPVPNPSEFITRVNDAALIGGFICVAFGVGDDEIAGFVSAEPTWADGVLGSQYCVVDHEQRRVGVARLLKAAQRAAAAARGWRLLIVDVPSPGHVMGRIAAELGAVGLANQSWRRGRE